MSNGEKTNLCPSEVVHSGVALLQFVYHELGNPPKHTVIFDPERKMPNSTSALPPFRLSAVCAHAVTKASHNRVGMAEKACRSCSSRGSTPEFWSSHRSTPSFSQCVCWLGEAAIQWPFPCRGGETHRVNPGLAGADTGKWPVCQVRQFYCSEDEPKTGMSQHSYTSS